jgi:hypothetical protein
MSKEPKRYIEIEGLDKRLELSKYAKVKSSESIGEFIYLDELKDGTWRLVHTKGVIPDMKEVEGFKIVRED